MSEYPSDWKVFPLGEVAEVVGGGTPSRDVPAFWGNDHYWITPSEVVVKDGQTVDRSKEQISNLGLQSSGAKLHPPGTILMTSRASIGFAAIAKEEICTNQGFQSLRCCSELDNWFALHQIRHRRAELQQLAAGSTFLEVSGSNVRSFPFIVPPLPEQKKIAEILSGIDNLTNAVRERIYRLQIALDGLANSWETRLSIQGEEGILGDLIDSIDSGWSPACEEFPPKSGEWGVLKVSAVTRGEFYEAESKRLPPNLPPREQFIVKKNDLLITRANGNLDLVGRGVIVSKEPGAKLLMSDKILRLNPRSNCDRNFLLLALNSHSVRQQIEIGVGGSTGAKNIGQGFLRQIAIAIPSSSEQVRIGNLSRSLSTALISTKRKFEHLVSLKMGLSSDLLSGRKRVSV